MEKQGIFSYIIRYNEAIIVDCDESAKGNIVFPSEIEGCPVTEINCFGLFRGADPERITVPESVKALYIGNEMTRCFHIERKRIEGGNRDFVLRDGVLFNEDQTTLLLYPAEDSRREYTVPDSVKRIGENAFHNARNLCKIHFPIGVEEIGDGAFRYCSGLTWMRFPHSVKKIGDEAFLYCSALQHVELPIFLSEIGDLMFYGCSNLSYIEIPDGVTCIGNHAFCGCKSLEDIRMPNRLTSIEEGAFKDCRNLNVVAIPESVTSIGAFAFYDCRNLTQLVAVPDTLRFVEEEQECDEEYSDYLGFFIFAGDSIPAGVTKIEKFVFSGCRNLLCIKLPDSVTSIGESAFSGCRNLLDIVMPDKVTSIGMGAFQDCRLLRFVRIPNGVTDIGISVFEDCRNLRHITIPESVTSIGDSAFNGCDNLKNIRIPESVTSIGDSAFSGCYGLTDINLPDGVIYIEDNAFHECGLTEFRIPAGVTDISRIGLFDCGSLTSVHVDENNPNYSSVDGVLFDKNQTTLICYPSGNPRTSYTIPDGVTNIGDHAFSSCGNLTGIHIPSSVKSIGPYAFCILYKLENICYAGTPEQWQAIDIIDFENDTLTNAAIRYNCNPDSDLSAQES